LSEYTIYINKSIPNKKFNIMHQSEFIYRRSIKESLEKVKQIGEENYQKAMKHVDKFNKYEQ